MPYSPVHWQSANLLTFASMHVDMFGGIAYDMKNYLVCNKVKKV